MENEIYRGGMVMKVRGRPWDISLKSNREEEVREG